MTPQQPGQVVQRQLQRYEGRDALPGGHLLWRVIAVAAVLIHLRGAQQPGVGIEAQLRDAEADQAGELADGEEAGGVVHRGSLKSPAA